MKQRVITAIFFVAAMLGGIFGGTTPFFLLFSIITMGSLWELANLMLPREETFFTTRRLLTVATGSLPVLIWGWMSLTTNCQENATWHLRLESASGWAVGWLLLNCSIFLFELFTLPRQPFSNLAAMFLGIFYISLPIIFLFEIAGLPCQNYQPVRVLGIIGLVWVSDTVAYFVGSKLGRHKLFEQISPKKTWEGTLGGVIGTVAVAVVASQFLPQFSKVEWWSIGLVVSVMATLGDLIESMLKRSVGVKDSGNLLPGHGGLLDRFDAFIFVLPFVWAVLWVLEKLNF